MSTQIITKQREAFYFCKSKISGMNIMIPNTYNSLLMALRYHKPRLDVFRSVYAPIDTTPFSGNVPMRYYVAKEGKDAKHN